MSNISNEEIFLVNEVTGSDGETYYNVKTTSPEILKRLQEAQEKLKNPASPEEEFSQLKEQCATLGITPLTWKASAVPGESANLNNSLRKDDFKKSVRFVEDESMEISSSSLSHAERAMFIAGIIKADGDPMDKRNRPWLKENEQILLEGENPVDWGRNFYIKRLKQDKDLVTAPIWFNESDNADAKDELERFLKINTSKEKRLLNDLFLYSTFDEDEEKVANILANSNEIDEAENGTKPKDDDQDYDLPILNLNPEKKDKEEQQAQKSDEKQKIKDINKPYGQMTDEEKVASDLIKKIKSGAKLPQNIPVTVEIAEILAKQNVKINWISSDKWVEAAQSFNADIKSNPKYDKVVRDVNQLNMATLKGMIKQKNKVQKKRQWCEGEREAPAPSM